jgi:predicted TIM-barrel fold metal-dependent hydrolase
MAHYPADVREQRVATFQYYLSKEYFVQTWKAHPDRFLWLANSIDPRVPGYVERAAKDLAMGANGLKILPPFVDMYISHPGWTPIIELLRRWGKPCTIDLSYWYTAMPWFAPSIYGKYRDYDHYVEGMHKVAVQFPDVTFLLAHYGTPALINRGDSTRTIHYDRLQGPIKLVRPHPNLYLDLAAYQHLIYKGEEFPYASAQKLVEILVGELGAERIVWGTDWPYLGEQPWRRFDVTALAMATDAFARLFSNDNALLRLGRDLGMGLVNALPAARRTAIREAAGLTGTLPRLLRGRPL